MSGELSSFFGGVQEACKLLAQFTEGKSLDEYAADPLLRSAVERQFEVIGEALRQMLNLEPGLSSLISVHKRIIDFRNRLIHGYADIAHDIVWGVLESNLPKLRREVSELLSSAENES